MNDADDRDNSGVYAEVLSDFSERWFITLGFRQDDNEDFGEFTSYRLSSAYLIDLGGNTLKLQGAVGRGFRAPSLYELSYHEGPWASPPAAGLALNAEQVEVSNLVSNTALIAMSSNSSRSSKTSKTQSISTSQALVATCSLKDATAPKALNL